MFKTYYQDINYLESLINMPRQEYALGLGDRRICIIRLKKFLALVGSPHQNQKFIHITGTSGKGSTVNVLHQLLADGSLKVGAYISPFATTSLEKIQINGRLMSPAELHKILNKKIKPALDKYLTKYSVEAPSYFEMWLAVALIYFQEAKCDWVILEAGLGGTHDATNVIAKPIVTAITNIGLDHTEVLGPNKQQIALDKAGIIKSGSKFLTTEKSARLLKLFRNKCRRQKAEFVPLKNLAIHYKSSPYFSTHKQKENLNLALNIMATLGIKAKNPKKIINQFQMNCRQEIIQKKPLIIMDGAHNADKIDNLLEFVKQQPYKKLHLIIAFAFSKNWSYPLKKLLAISDQLYITHFLISSRKSANLRRLYKFSEKIVPAMPKKIFSDPWQALDSALKNANKQDLILITGSFFLCGELRKKWISEKYILKTLQLRPKPRK